MTTATTIVAVLWALAIWRVLDLFANLIVNYFQDRKWERELQEAHDEINRYYDALEAESIKPKKKAVAKKK